MQSRSVAIPRTDLLVSTVAVVSVALLTALAAQISITLPGTPVPQTLQTMAVLGGSAYLGSRRGLAAMLLYVGMGLFLPFYAHEAPFRSYFYLNLGNGQFQECADSAGVALRGLPLPLRPEGVAVADMNGDGTLDLYCAHHLFTNDGHAHFTDVG